MEANPAEAGITDASGGGNGQRADRDTRDEVTPRKLRILGKPRIPATSAAALRSGKLDRSSAAEN